jgi:hypothetical protein
MPDRAGSALRAMSRRAHLFPNRVDSARRTIESESMSAMALTGDVRDGTGVIRLDACGFCFFRGLPAAPGRVACICWRPKELEPALGAAFSGSGWPLIRFGGAASFVFLPLLACTIEPDQPQ